MRASRWRMFVLRAVIISGLISGPATDLSSFGAAGEPGYDVPPHPGKFERSAPVYAETVDSWDCHFFGPCRDEARVEGDPRPIGRASEDEAAEISCEFGSYLLLSTDKLSDVWAPQSAVSSDYRHVTCSVLQWW